MKKSKAAICTVLLYVVLVGLFMLLNHFCEPPKVLLIEGFCTCWLIMQTCEKFYHWIREDKQ